MLIQAKQLLHLPVESVAGIRLGEISGFDIDIELHTVSRYLVKTSYLPRPFATELVVSPKEVVSITAEKMVVEDGVVPAANAVPTPAS